MSKSVVSPPGASFARALSSTFRLVLLIAVAGCKEPSLQTEPAATTPVDNAETIARTTPENGTAKIGGARISDLQAMQIAERIVRKRQNLDQVEADGVLRRPDGTIQVVVWRIPAMPGGHYEVLLSRDGKLIDYRRGL